MALLLCLLLVIPTCYAVPSSIVKPCDLANYECIRENLAANSQCNPQVSNKLSSKYTIDSFRFETPYFNSSYIDKNLIIQNHDQCSVSQFFYNLEKDNAVLAIRCPGLDFSSTRTLIQHYPEAEDVTYSYDFRGKYPEIILTVNLQPANVMDLCKTSAFAYVSALPTFYINPKDKKTQKFLSTDLSYLNIFERESLQYRANELMRYFINNKLCDFGCNF